VTVTDRKIERRDLTIGNVLAKLVMFAIPLVLSNLVFNIYSIIESIIVGNSVGSDALAVIGSCMPIIMMFNSIFMGLSMGSEIVVSQYYGGKNSEMLKKATNTMFTLSLLVGASLAILGILISGPILSLLGTPDNIIADSTLYLRILFIGMFGNVIYYVGSSVVRGMGDSRWPLFFFIFNAGVNILLDILFIMLFGWEIKGIALATVIAQTSAGLFVFLRVNFGDYGIKIKLKQLTLDATEALKIIRLAIPSSMHSVAMSLSSLVVQTFQNSFGSNYISAHSIALRTDGLMVMPIFAFGMAMTTFTGQNIGAGKVDRVNQGVKSGLILISSVAVVLSAIMWVIGPNLLNAFTDNTAVLAIGSSGIRILSMSYIFMAVEQSIAGTLRGAGFAIPPMISSIIANIIRIPAAYYIAVVPGNQSGIFISMLITSAVGAFIMFTYYLKGNWRRRQDA
jgi:putative MATE family efflux protein